MSELFTVTREKAEEIRNVSYFPFTVIWLTEHYYHVPDGYYITISNKTNTPEYFAQLLAEWAIGNDDYAHDLKVAQILGIDELFKKECIELLNH